MKSKYKTTKEERAIIRKLPISRIEKWIEKKEYWRVYRIVIKVTKDYVKSQKSEEKS